ncbi:MAG: hypothetical protein KIT84_02800 [Labilithrix sp.]|nr:hypothetical protein [Labilithrix sp.]MCW5809910.1 hypothetical protein [Labilithrix sp.]
MATDACGHGEGEGVENTARVDVRWRELTEAANAAFARGELRAARVSYEEARTEAARILDRASREARTEAARVHVGAAREARTEAARVHVGAAGEARSEAARARAVGEAMRIAPMLFVIAAQNLAELERREGGAARADALLLEAFERLVRVAEDPSAPLLLRASCGRHLAPALAELGGVPLQPLLDRANAAQRAVALALSNTPTS